MIVVTSGYGERKNFTGPEKKWVKAVNQSLGYKAYDAGYGVKRFSVDLISLYAIADIGKTTTNLSPFSNL
jgi:hypothetical protein